MNQPADRESFDGESFDQQGLQIERLPDDLRREVLSAYLDGELSPEAARHVTAWLDAHPEALKEVEHLRRVWDLLGLYADEPVPEGFAARVIAGAASARAEAGSGSVGGAAPRRGERGLRMPRPRVLAAAAAVLVALGAGFLALRGGEEPAVTPPAATASLEEVPAEYLEQVDVLLTLSDDEFEGFLLADLAEPWEDG